jgi:hypothetical protein
MQPLAVAQHVRLNQVTVEASRQDEDDRRDDHQADGSPRPVINRRIGRPGDQHRSNLPGSPNRSLGSCQIIPDWRAVLMQIFKVGLLNQFGFVLSWYAVPRHVTLPVKHILIAR